MSEPMDDGAECVCPKCAPSPSPVLEVTWEMVLAGCQVTHPGLFRDGLEPQKRDGPATVRMMNDTVKLVRSVLIAALRVR